MCQYHNHSHRVARKSPDPWSSDITLNSPIGLEYQATRTTIVAEFGRLSKQDSFFKNTREQARAQMQALVSEMQLVLSESVSSRITQLTPVIHAVHTSNEAQVKQRAIDAVAEIRTLSDISRSLSRSASANTSKRFNAVLAATDAIWCTFTSSPIESSAIQKVVLEKLKTILLAD